MREHAALPFIMMMRRGPIRAAAALREPGMMIHLEPRFHVTDENASFVAQICSRLDGIPLAIELAAARVKLFMPQQIAERLDHRFKLLTGSSRTSLPRQQTLRALIDWSYGTLNETEQRALRARRLLRRVDD
jgi:predicted ATPase